MTQNKLVSWFLLLYPNRDDTHKTDMELQDYKP
jgi:hypothetical protein